MKLIGNRKQNPLISVIIPVYNVERYLGGCLDGVVNQTYTNLEILCIDDGSIDSSSEILAKFAGRDKRLRVFSQKNSGVAIARNVGLDLVSGEYISFLDADDIYETSLYEDVLPEALKARADICVYRSDQFFDDFTNRLSNEWAFNESLIPNKRVFSLKDVPRHAFSVFNGYLWDKLFKAEFVKKHQLQFHATRAASDARFVHMALAVAKRISTVRKVLAHHRKDRAGALTKDQERDYRSFYLSYTGLRDDLRAAGLFERFEQAWLNRVLHTGLWYLISDNGAVNEEFFTLLKESWLNDFGLSDKDESYFMSSDIYRRLEQIKSLSYDEFSKIVQYAANQK